MLRQHLKKSLAEVFYPPVCPLCERLLTRREELVCERCRGKLPVVREPLCACCGAPLSSETALLCGNCERHAHSFTAGRSAFVYEKRLRRAVDKMKFQNRRCYVPFFAGAMAQLARQVFPRWKPACLIPVPMHPKKRRERGFDQAYLLARSLSGQTGVPLLAHVLERTRYTQASKKLGRTARRRNLRGAFSVREGTLLQGSVVLIDDIYTTGTTMDEAARALKGAGAEEVYFLTASIVQGEELLC